MFTTKSEFINKCYTETKQAIREPGAVKSPFFCHQFSTPVADKNVYKDLVEGRYNRCNYYKYPNLHQQDFIIYQSLPQSGKLLLGELHQLKTNALTCTVKTILFELIAITPQNLPHDTCTTYVIRATINAEIKPTVDTIFIDLTNDIIEDEEKPTIVIDLSNDDDGDDDDNDDVAAVVDDDGDADSRTGYNHSCQSKSEKRESENEAQEPKWILSPTPYFKNCFNLSSTSSGLIGNVGKRTTTSSSSFSKTNLPTFELAPGIGFKRKRVSSKFHQRKATKYNNPI